MFLLLSSGFDLRCTTPCAYSGNNKDQKGRNMNHKDRPQQQPATNNNTEKAPFRITTLRVTPNPRYVAGSNHPRKRNYDIEARTHTFFNTIEDAQAYREEHGGTIEALSASGKSYQTYKPQQQPA